MADRESPAVDFAERFEAASAGGEVRLAELPFLTQVDLRIDPDGSAAEKITLALDMPLPTEPGGVRSSGELSALWLGPDEWLILGPERIRRELVDRLEIASGAEHVSIVDVSAQRTTLLVAGPRARDLLAHGCALDLHPRVFGTGRCAQTMLARTKVVLVNRDTGEPRFWVLCGSSFAPYLAAWLLDAATEYLPPEPGTERHQLRETAPSL